MIRIRWRTWSNASTVSNTMKPAAGCDSFNAGARRQRHRFEPGSGVVPEEAHRAAGEPRQTRYRRRPVVRHQAPKRGHQRLVERRCHAAALDRRTAADVRAQDQERVLAEEGVPADVLAALHALEQEGVVGVPGDLQKGRDRRQQVGHDLLADRHERALGRQRLEFLERGRSHASPAIRCNRSTAAARMTSRGAFIPVHHSNCLAACAVNISRPEIATQPAASACRSSAVLWGL